MVEHQTCNLKVVGSSPGVGYHLSLHVVSPSQKLWSRLGRVRQLALRASLESVGDSDRSPYKCKVPPVCIPRATGDKGVKRISPHTLGTRDRATTCHQTARGGFSA